jgi:hypothetical protein
MFIKVWVVTYSREKWEMCIKGMALLFICYVDNVEEQTDINC